MTSTLTRDHTFFNEGTELIPAIEDFYDGPTQKIIRIPKKTVELPTTGKQIEHAHMSIQEPEHSVIAWLPIAIFMTALMLWAWAVVYGWQHINEIMYVLLVKW